MRVTKNRFDDDYDNHGVENDVRARPMHSRSRSRYVYMFAHMWMWVCLCVNSTVALILCVLLATCKSVARPLYPHTQQNKYYHIQIIYTLWTKTARAIRIRYGEWSYLVAYYIFNALWFWFVINHFRIVLTCFGIFVDDAAKLLIANNT